MSYISCIQDHTVCTYVILVSKVCHRPLPLFVINCSQYFPSYTSIACETGILSTLASSLSCVSCFSSLCTALDMVLAEIWSPKYFGWINYNALGVNENPRYSRWPRPCCLNASNPSQRKNVIQTNRKWNLLLFYKKSNVNQ